MSKRLHEAPSTACEGCEYFSEGTCESPTCCIHRRIEGTRYTVKDVMKDLYENHIQEIKSKKLP